MVNFTCEPSSSRERSTCRCQPLSRAQTLPVVPPTNPVAISMMVCAMWKPSADGKSSFVHRDLCISSNIQA
eukprot:4544255-Karenia_brevis.AAC.1